MVHDVDSTSELVIENGCIINSKIKVHRNSKVIICSGAEIRNDVVITAENNSSIVIGTNTLICKNSELLAFDHASTIIGHNILVQKCSEISSFNHGNTEIADRTTIGSYAQVRCHETQIVIGEDCMFAQNITVIAGDGHRFFSIETDECLNNNRPIIIGKHVWVGAKSLILQGCNVGDGSIIGAGSFANKRYPNNTMMAGNPAKIIRENIRWER